MELAPFSHSSTGRVARPGFPVGLGGAHYYFRYNYVSFIQERLEEPYSLENGRKLTQAIKDLNLC